MVLALVGPRTGSGHRSLITQPLVYSLPPVEAGGTAAPAPQQTTRRPRPAREIPPPDVAQQFTPPKVDPPSPESESAPEPPSTEAAAPARESSSPASIPFPEPVRALIPGSLKLKYDIQGELRGLTYRADGELLWTHDGRDYEARLEISAFLLGSRVQLSRGRVTSAGLQPFRFSDTTRRERSVELDHSAGLARFSAGTPSASFRDGAQDQLSVFLQLAILLVSDPGSYPPGSKLSMQVVSTKDVQSWQFVVSEAESLSLPIGEVVAYKFTRQVQRNDGELQAEVWLAPAFGWLPARLRLSQPNGDYIDQQWRGTAPF